MLSGLETAALRRQEAGLKVAEIQMLSFSLAMTSGSGTRTSEGQSTFRGSREEARVGRVGRVQAGGREEKVKRRFWGSSVGREEDAGDVLRGMVLTCV